MAPEPARVNMISMLLEQDTETSYIVGVRQGRERVFQSFACAKCTRQGGPQSVPGDRKHWKEEGLWLWLWTKVRILPKIFRVNLGRRRVRHMCVHYLVIAVDKSRQTPRRASESEVNQVLFRNFFDVFYTALHLVETFQID